MPWLDEQLQDLLLFAPETYWRMLALANGSVWPVPLVFPVLLVFCLVVPWRNPRSCSYLVAGLLAAAWIWCGGYFVGRWYAAINGWAGYAAPFCYLQALLVAWFGVVRCGFGRLAATGLRRATGWGLCLGALLAYPLLALVRGQTVADGEFAGTAPDPTAVVTLGLCVLTRRVEAWICLPVPLLVCGPGFLTLRAMESWQAWIPLTAALAGGFLAAGGSGAGKPSGELSGEGPGRRRERR